VDDDAVSFANVERGTGNSPIVGVNPYERTARTESKLRRRRSEIYVDHVGNRGAIP
jgi:hypothetical protein